MNSAPNTGMIHDSGELCNRSSSCSAGLQPGISRTSANREDAALKGGAKKLLSVAFSHGL